MEILGITHNKKKSTSLEVRMTKREIRIFNSGKYAFRLIPGDGDKYYDVSGIDPENLLQVIFSYFKYPLKTLKTKRRDRNLVNVRMFVSYYLRTYTTMSFKEIGQMFDKDHASIVHMMKRWNSEIIYQDTKRKKNDIDELLKAKNII